MEESVTNIYQEAKNLYIAKDCERSIELFTKVLEIDQKHSLSFFGRAMCYRSLALESPNDKITLFQKSVLDFNKALELDPSLIDVLARRAQIYHHFLKEFTKAFKDYQAYLKMKPSDDTIIYEKNSLLVYHFKLGEKQLDSCKKDLEKILNKEQDNSSFAKKLKELLEKIEKVKVGETKEDKIDSGPSILITSPRHHKLPEESSTNQSPIPLTSGFKKGTSKDHLETDSTHKVQVLKIQEALAQKKERIRTATVLLGNDQKKKAEERQKSTLEIVGKHREGSFLRNPNIINEEKKIHINPVINIENIPETKNKEPKISVSEKRRQERRSTLVQMTKEVSKIVGDEILLYGFAEKLGEKVKSWTERYFVLYSNGTMEYYNGVKGTKNAKEIADYKKGDLKGKITVSSCRFTYIKGPNLEPFGFVIYLKNGRDFTISFNDKQTSLQWKQAFVNLGMLFEEKEQPNSQIVYASFGEKLGEKVKNWTERYFVLYTNGDLEYYYGVKGNKISKEIYDFKKGELKGKFNISNSNFKPLIGYEGHEFGFSIALEKRDFCFAFPTRDIMEDWKKALLHVDCTITNQSKSGSRGSKSQQSISYRCKFEFLEMRDLISENNKERTYYFALNDEGNLKTTTDEVILKSNETNAKVVKINKCSVEFDTNFELDKGKIKEKVITISLFVDGKKTFFGSAKPSWSINYNLSTFLTQSQMKPTEVEKVEHIKFSRHAIGTLYLKIYMWSVIDNFQEAFKKVKSEKIEEPVNLVVNEEEDAEEKRLLEEALKEEQKKKQEEKKRIEEIQRKIKEEEERIKLEEEEERKKEEEKKRKLEKLKEEQEKKRLLKEEEEKLKSIQKEKEEEERKLIEEEKRIQEEKRREEELKKEEELRKRREKRIEEEKRKKEEELRQLEEEFQLAEELRKKNEEILKQKIEEEDKLKQQGSEKRSMELKIQNEADEILRESLRLKRETELQKKKEEEDRKKEEMIQQRGSKIKKIETEEKEKEEEQKRIFLEEKQIEDEKRKREEDEQREEEEKKKREEEQKRIEEEKKKMEQDKKIKEEAQKIRENLILDKKKRDEEEKRKLLQKRLERKNVNSPLPEAGSDQESIKDRIILEQLKKEKEFKELQKKKEEELEEMKRIRNERMEKEKLEKESQKVEKNNNKDEEFEKIKKQREERLEKERLEKEEEERKLKLKMENMKQEQLNLFKEAEQKRLEKESQRLAEELRKRELEEKARLESEERLKRAQEMMAEKQRKFQEEEARSRREKEVEIEKLKKQKEEEIENIRKQKEKLAKGEQERILKEKEKELEEIEKKRIQEEKEANEREEKLKQQQEIERKRLEDEKIRQEKIKREAERIKLEQEKERIKIEEEKRILTERIQKEEEEKKEKERKEKEEKLKKEKAEQEEKERKLKEEKEEKKKKLEENLKKPKEEINKHDSDEEPSETNKSEDTMDDMLSMFLGEGEEEGSTKIPKKTQQTDKKDLSIKLASEAIIQIGQLKKTYDDLPEENFKREPTEEEKQAEIDLKKLLEEKTKTQKLFDEKVQQGKELNEKIQILEQKINRMENEEDQCIEEFLLTLMTNEEKEEYYKQQLEVEEKEIAMLMNKKKDDNEKKKKKSIKFQQEEEEEDKLDLDEDLLDQEKTEEEIALEEELRLLEEEERLLEQQLKGEDNHEEDEELKNLQKEVNDMKLKKLELLEKVSNEEKEKIIQEDEEFNEQHQYSSKEERLENLLYDLYDQKSKMESQIEYLQNLLENLNKEKEILQKKKEEEKKLKFEKANQIYTDELTKLYDERDKIEIEIHELEEEEMFVKNDLEKLNQKESIIRLKLFKNENSIDTSQFPELEKKLKVLERLRDKKQINQDDFEIKKEVLLEEYFPERKKKVQQVVQISKPPPKAPSLPPPLPKDNLTKKIELKKEKKQQETMDHVDLRARLLSQIVAKKKELVVIEKDKKKEVKVSKGWIGEEIIKNRFKYETSSSDSEDFD